MTPSASETLQKIKELRNLANDTERKLEKDGLSITNIAKEQLFNYNIRSLISAVEALLRNEPSEKPIMRLEKDIPDTYSNLSKVENTPQGKNQAENLRRIKELIGYIEQNYKRL